MGIVGGTGSGRRVLAEIRHFLFCYNLCHFASLHPHNKKIFLKFKTQGGGRKRRGRRGWSHLTRRRDIDDEAVIQRIQMDFPVARGVRSSKTA